MGPREEGSAWNKPLSGNVESALYHYAWVIWNMLTFRVTF
jgi:hypothetical protein